MELTARRAARDPRAVEAWRTAIAAVARRVDSAWAALEQGAAREEAAWREDVEQVRGWRRPRWPLWLLTVATIAAALWLGLVLGGFLDVPGLLRPLAEWWWSR
jgi:ferric-dicitrate binding protein FerR (iron transport regulator)